jgi:phenylacetate-CoA ligase/benzoylacetate-CoA ligase
VKSSPQRYWNEALETLPWTEVEAWQSAQLGSYLQALVRRSPMYAQLYEGLPADLRCRSLADLQALPFTLKDNVRAAQEASSAANPLGSNQGVGTEEIIQVLSSSGSTGTPIYYGLTARDADAVTDAVANTFFTAGIRRSDVIAHLVGLPMLAGGLPMPTASAASVRRFAGWVVFLPIGSCARCEDCAPRRCWPRPRLRCT